MASARSNSNRTKQAAKKQSELPRYSELDLLLRAAFRFRPESVAPLAQRIRGRVHSARTEKRAERPAPEGKRKLPTPRHEAVACSPSATQDELLAAARTGDAAAFGELAHRLKRRLLAAAMHITRNQHDAEDIVQTACLNAFSHIQTFRGECAFSTWLLRITVNEALACSRESRRAQLNREELDDYDEGVFQERPLGDWQAQPESLAARHQLRRVLRAELEKLPPKYSAVFVMRDVEGFSTAEVAEALNLTLTAVRVRLLRARGKLRERLRAHFAGAGGLPQLRPSSGARVAL
jgi:RNA polymerase sigma-70 factor (ECF subfamily)